MLGQSSLPNDNKEIAVRCALCTYNGIYRDTVKELRQGSIRGHGNDLGSIG